MKTKRLIVGSFQCYPIGLDIRVFMIVFCVVLLSPMLLCALVQNTSHTVLSDKAVNSCGPLAIRTVMSVLGHPIDIARCAELAGTDPNGVTTLAGIQSAAEALGQSCKGMRLGPNELTFINCPAILHVSTPSAEDHFVVFTSSNRNLFELIDPSRGEQKNLYTADQLHLMWKGNCIVFTENAFWVSVLAGTYRARGIITAIVGAALGIFAALSMASCLSRYSRLSLDSMTASSRKSTVVALGLVTMVAAGIAFLGMRTIGNNQSKEKGPRLILGATVLNIGNVEWGKSVASSIWVSNGGSSMLNIDKKKIMTSCSCVRATISQEELARHDKAELGVKLKAPGRVGPFEYSVYIPSNEPEGGKILVVKGRVTGRGGVVYPPQLYFGRVESTEKVRKSLFYILRQRDIKVVDVTSDSPFVVCEFNRPNAGSFEINVSLAEFPKPGPFEGTIKITTNDPEGRDVIVPFSGIAIPQASAECSLRLSN